MTLFARAGKKIIRELKNNALINIYFVRFLSKIFVINIFCHNHLTFFLNLLIRFIFKQIFRINDQKSITNECLEYCNSIYIRKLIT